MNRSLSLKLALIALCLSLPALAQDSRPTETEEKEVIPEWPQRELRFKISETTLTPEDYQARPGMIWPKYAATCTVYIPNSAYEGLFRSKPRSADPDAQTAVLLKTAAASRFSAAQIEFIKASPWMTRENTNKLVYSLTFFAMTEDDARLMVEAAFELMDAEPRVGYDNTLAALIEKQSQREQIRADLDRAAKELEEAQIPYQTALDAAGYENQETVRRELERLDVSLRTLEVTIAGINAKIAAIEKLQLRRNPPLDRDTESMLGRLHVEQDVELAGALAQKQVLQNHRDAAATVIRTRGQLDAAIEKKNVLRDNLRRANVNVKQYIDRLGNPVNQYGMALLQGGIQIQPLQFP